MQTIIGTDISYAKKLLEQGDLVAIPTETVYGLAANALNGAAIARIYEVKNRPRFNPLIMHVPGIEHIGRYAAISKLELKIAGALMPGPLTLLLPKTESVPDILTAGSDKVAVRVPAHPLTQQLLQQLSFPVAAPSANPSGYVSPVTANHVLENLDGKIPYILDGGPSEVGVESTIIECTSTSVIVHRFGGITLEQIRAAAGMPVILQTNSQKIVTSGKLKSHYAPNIPLYMGNVAELASVYEGKRIAVITLSPSELEGVTSFPLSASGSLAEAAANLFSTLRRIDQEDFDVILAEKMPEQGLGRAINDRLHRAQAEFKDGAG